MSKLSNVSKHYLLMDYYLMSFTYIEDKPSNRKKLILKELNKRIKGGSWEYDLEKLKIR